MRAEPSATININTTTVRLPLHNVRNIFALLGRVAESREDFFSGRTAAASSALDDSF